jgi:hypothetical protein
MIPSATDFISARRSIFPSWQNLAFVWCDDKAVVYGKLIGDPMTSRVKFRMLLSEAEISETAAAFGSYGVQDPPGGEAATKH